MTSPNSSNTTSKFSGSGNVTIDPLLDETFTKWGYGKATAYLSFSFPWINGNLASWQNNYDSNNPQNATYHFGLNSIQQQAARDALQSWSNVANVNFSEVSETSANVGDFRFTFSSALESGIWGYSQYPNNYWASSADVWINSDLGNDKDWEVGTYNYESLMHEIGHGLGLKHPGNYNGNNGSTPGPYLSSTLDNRLYTIMSYNDPLNNFYPIYGNLNGKSTFLTWNINPETPMVLDIAAIQYIYGANYSYKTGDDVYTFNPLNPFFKTIWDAGGDDTIDITNFSTNCVIDLIPGNYSSIRFPKPADTGGQTATYDGTNNLGIAYNCYIENAKGGTGNDQIIGNDFANELDGGDGNDSLNGGNGDDLLDWDINLRGGDDTLIGGLGNDRYCIRGNDLVIENASGGMDTVFVATNYSIINTYLENIRAYSNSNENLQFTGNSFDNFLQGALGNDTLIGGNGNDTLDGGDGIDTVILNGSYADYGKSLNSTTNLYTFIKNTGISTTDYISNIEIFKFTNRTLKAANLFDLSKAPTLNSFSSPVATGIEDNSVTITFSTLQAQGDESDIDGTVDAFVIKAVNSGILKIGTSDKTATNWDVNSNNIIDSTHTAYWIPVANINGRINLFTTTVRDNEGLESTNAVQALINIQAINDAPLGNVTISGKTLQNQTLTASNTLADADGLGLITYQWLSNGSIISGATQSTYLLTPSDSGKNISVKASYTDQQNTAESVTSSPTAKVENVNDSPTGNVSITGTVTQNQILTASNTVADADGLGIFNYQWLSNGNNISNATQPTYALTQADVGKSISVKASYIDGFGTTESVTSSPTTKVENVNDLPTGEVSISGIPKKGQILSASNTLNDLDGMGTVTYKWISDDSTLSTDQNYKLSYNDAGKTISISANYLDATGTSESVSSPIIKIARIIDEPLAYANISFSENPSLESTYSYPAFKPLNNLLENLSGLKWTSLIYDDTQPSYNLTFNSIDSPNVPVGLFIINHKITGDYIIGSNDINNGTITDDVTASYGAIDKSIFSINESTATKLDSNQEPASKKYSGTFTQSMCSSNNSIDDTTDDYNHKISYNKSSTYIYKTDKYTDTAKYSSIYKSQNMNYSSSWNGTTTQDENSFKLLESGKISYLNHDIEYGTIKANFNFVTSKTNDITTKTYSKASFSLNSDDKSTASNLTFSGTMVKDTYQTQIQLKNFTLDISDFKIVSGAVFTTANSTIDDTNDFFSTVSDLLTTENDVKMIIEDGISLIQTLTQGANTITIKNVDGIEVDAGEGKDTIIGAAGNDKIIGGAGSDKLTGGKGSDTFRFNKADFYTDNANWDSVFNKSVDTIADFNLAENDILDFGDLGPLSFYPTLSAAKADNAQLFYVKGSGSIYLITDTFTSSVIITLTGKPAVNAEMTDWNYSA